MPFKLYIDFTLLILYHKTKQAWEAAAVKDEAEMKLTVTDSRTEES